MYLFSAGMLVTVRGLDGKKKLRCDLELITGKNIIIKTATIITDTKAKNILKATREHQSQEST
jgi:hypothetical protein